MSTHHHHGHGHHEHRNAHLKTVVVVLCMTAAFMVVEVAYGFWTNSLALLADGVHMGTDVASLVLTTFAFLLSRRPANDKKTFGYYRIEIFAAFLNSLFLSLLAIGVIYSAVLRLEDPPEVRVDQMIIVAFIGLIVNIVSGFFLHKGAKENINLKGAFLHVVGDALASVGTMLAGALMWWKGWWFADPAASILISVIILYSAYRLMSETIHLILQGVPMHLHTSAISDELRKVDGVADLHHLHVWGLSSDVVVLTVHLVTGSGDQDKVLTRAQKVLKDKFNIAHTTIQLESVCLKDKEPHFP
jgi:cobalt-zinc-cadmium efflux system protein